MVAHRLVETDVVSAADAVAAIVAKDQNGYGLEASVDGDSLLVQVIEQETNATMNVVVPGELLGSPIFEHLRKAHMRLAEIVGGLPPFKLQLGKESEYALTFEELRSYALGLAKTGIQITRFKGLSEMNAPELWKTTMDPANRMIVRVEVEDAAAADLWFSRLMGDEVEPRRAFIEQNALEVRNLDV